MVRGRDRFTFANHSDNFFQDRPVLLHINFMQHRNNRLIIPFIPFRYGVEVLLSVAQIQIQPRIAVSPEHEIEQRSTESAVTVRKRMSGDEFRMKQDSELSWFCRGKKRCGLRNVGLLFSFLF